MGHSEAQPQPDDTFRIEPRNSLNTRKKHRRHKTIYNLNASILSIDPVSKPRATSRLSHIRPIRPIRLIRPNLRRLLTPSSILYASRHIPAIMPIFLPFCSPKR
jgi:hypothetical protein